jgi:hypothetical protein
MKANAYVETTVISYLTAQASRDIVVAAHQQITCDWWKSCRDKFTLFGSQLVLQEAGAGDTDAAKARRNVVADLKLLEITEESIFLAERLVQAGAVPQKAAADALHIAVSVVNGMEYLVTWNCKHLANAFMRVRIDAVCRIAAYEPVVICTPEELLEVVDDLE